MISAETLIKPKNITLDSTGCVILVQFLNRVLLFTNIMKHWRHDIRQYIYSDHYRAVILPIDQQNWVDALMG
jgi:hypothetical protein